jgi:hypothetical protein
MQQLIQQQQQQSQSERLLSTTYRQQAEQARELRSVANILQTAGIGK